MSMSPMMAAPTDTAWWRIPAMPHDASPRRRSGAAALAVGSVVSGLLAYVFFALVTRGLGAVQAAPVAVLWAYWGFAAAGVTFPVQHWVARSVAADGHEGSVRGGLARVAGLALVATAVSAGLAWLLREPLFGDDGGAFALLVGAVTLLSAVMGLVRGLLSAREGSARWRASWWSRTCCAASSPRCC